MSQEEGYARDNGISVAEARRRLREQTRVLGIMHRLRQRLEREEAGNFAGMRIVHRPELYVAVGFKRAPAETLRRYTRDPAFRPMQAASSEAELEPVRARLERQLTALGWSFGVGTDAQTGVVDADIFEEREAVERAQAQGRLDLSGPVRFTTLDPLRVPAVSDAARPWVRGFPQRGGRMGIYTSELSQGTLILKDGCLRLDRPGADDPIALFARELGLGLSPAGRLAIVSRQTGEATAHVGERLAMGGGSGNPVTDPAELATARAACGQGPVVQINTASSWARFRASRPHHVDERARRDRVSREEAYRRLRAEWAEDDRAYEARRMEANRGGP